MLKYYIHKTDINQKTFLFAINYTLRNKQNYNINYSRKILLFSIKSLIVIYILIHKFSMCQGNVKVLFNIMTFKTYETVTNKKINSVTEHKNNKKY